MPRKPTYEELKQTENPHLVDGKYSITDLVDMEFLQAILTKFSAATGFTTGFISYPDQKLLIGTGWRDICTKFHRVVPESEKHCQESNRFLTSQLKELKELNIKPCENGLVDGATPIIIKGKHIASLATGQILFEEPDIERFKKQAEKYGYDVDAYLDALQKVPIVTEEQFKSALVFLSEMAVMVGEMGLSNLKVRANAQELQREINEHKQTEVELQDSEIRYRTLFQETMQREQIYESLLKSTPDAVAIYNLDGETTYVNPAFTQIFGFTMKDIKGKRIPFVPEGEMEKTIAGIKQVLEVGSVAGFETKRLTKDGRVLDISLSSACYDDHEGSRTGIVVFLRDVTAAKQTERQLQQAQRMEAIGTLAGGIAHDFNNLLMGIQGRSSLMLLDKDSSHKNFGHLKGIEDHVKSAADLTGQLLAFARGGKYEVRPTDLNKLVKKQNRMFGRTKKEITIRGKYEENLWVAEVDPGQIEQVLLNLYVNAWQSMPGGGNLYIQTENVTLDENYTSLFEVRPGKFVKISVADTGVGMDESTRQRVFDPFFTTREMGRGTGLGLASVYGIIKNHGGFIDVYSEKGKGAAFDIYLPASDKEVIEEVELLKGLLKGSGTVLLVDDEAVVSG